MGRFLYFRYRVTIVKKMKLKNKKMISPEVKFYFYIVELLTLT